MSITLKVTLGPVYDAVAEQLDAQLQPVGMLEVLLTAQIVRAHWRLERCEKAQDPDHPDIDRIRHRAEISIRRNMAEIRQLQADRHLKAELNLNLPGITRVRDILRPALSPGRSSSNQNSGQRSHSGSNVEELKAKIAAVIQKEQELQSTNPKIQTHSVGRNTPCPCGSGQKHKRCCGKGAPPQYNLSPQRDRAA